jgi:hypothetical protein
MSETHTAEQDNVAVTADDPVSPYRLLTVKEAAKVYRIRTGRPITERQMRRRASRDRRTGKRGLPFIEDPNSKRLMISEEALMESAIKPYKAALAEWRKTKGRKYRY